ncbi:cysteine rich repeat-containing protein, partial [Thauera aminoaromatica]
MRPFHLTTTTAALVLALLGAGLAPSAHAQSARGACRADFAKFCKGTKPGDGRVLACLRHHPDPISAEAKASLETAQACADQARQLCGGGAGNGTVCMA